MHQGSALSLLLFASVMDKADRCEVGLQSRNGWRKGVRWFMWSNVYKTVVRLATFLETMLLKRQEEALLKFS